MNTAQPSKSTRIYNTAPMGGPLFPTAVSPKYAGQSAGRARMLTCLDQYKANEADNMNGGLRWIQKGGGYYSMCNRHLKGAGASRAGGEGLADGAREYAYDRQSQVGRLDKAPAAAPQANAPRV